MDGLPGVDLDSDLPAVLARIAAAGFDGVGINLARTARANIVAQVMADIGLTWEGQALVGSPDELARYVDQILELGGAHHLNIQIAPGIATVGEAVDLIDRLEAVARPAPIPVFYETHRGRLLNDLYFTCRLLDARPDLPLTGDLSHYVTTHEMSLPLEPYIAERMARVIGSCENFHARVSGPHQVQIGLDAAQNRPWLEQFLQWWSDGVANWRVRKAPGQTLAVMCELGPPPYAMVDADGQEFSDRWLDALALKDVFAGF